MDICVFNYFADEEKMSFKWELHGSKSCKMAAKSQLPDNEWVAGQLNNNKRITDNNKEITDNDDDDDNNNNEKKDYYW